MTAKTFGLHQCTVSKTLSEVCMAINEVLGPKHLYLPRNTEEMRDSVIGVILGVIENFPEQCY